VFLTKKTTVRAQRNSTTESKIIIKRSEKENRSYDGENDVNSQNLVAINEHRYIKNNKSLYFTFDEN
jgi:hypothetical protein